MVPQSALELAVNVTVGWGLGCSGCGGPFVPTHERCADPGIRYGRFVETQVLNRRQLIFWADAQYLHDCDPSFARVCAQIPP